VNPNSIEHLDHVADAGIRVSGKSAAEAFERAAEGMFSLMVDLGAVRADEACEVRRAARTLPDLLVEWLAALLAERDLSGLVFSRFVVGIDEADGLYRLEGKAYGEPLDLERHSGGVEVKGVSYLALRVAEERGRWMAQCVFDV
jgi:SHS2 domain-containing protein